MRKTGLLYRKVVMFIMIIFLFSGALSAQTTTYNFRHVNSNDGLNDGVVHAFAQDKYGYIWIGSIVGLNRYNGYKVKVFVNDALDSSSLPASDVRSMLCDSDGDLWIGFTVGLYAYDYLTGSFHRIPASAGIGINKIIQADKENYYLLTNKGLYHFNKKDFILSLIDLRDNKHQAVAVTRDACLYQSVLYLATDQGLVAYDISGKMAHYISFKENENHDFGKIAIDHEGNIWLAHFEDGAVLYKTNTRFSFFETDAGLMYTTKKVRDKITCMLLDKNDRLWIGTVSQGLALYNKQDHTFEKFTNDPLQPMSLVSNQTVNLFQDKQGFIWIGTEGYGVSYFNPDQNLFHLVLPSFNQSQSLPYSWARVAVEDREGNIWMGLGGALSMYNIHTSQYSDWENFKDKPKMLYSSSIRSLLCDDKGDIWIGTSDGLNRYHPGTKKMYFFGEKDSLPLAFCWAIIQDTKKTIWIGTNKGLYYFDTLTQKFHDLSKHPVLQAYAKYGIHSLYEDSHHILWMGLNGKGVLMYNPQQQTVKHWSRQEKEKITLIGNNITSIAEDKSGIIWFSTFDGLTAYDIKKDSFTSYTKSNGLSSIKTSSLLADDHNRLWIGTTRGLLMLDSSRKFFKSFDTQDGLSTVEFNDQTAYKAKDGRFIYPTLKGFVIFDPREYTEKAVLANVYLTAFKIFNKDFNSGVNDEEMRSISLKYDQNFFSFELTALNYANPQQIWYAYKLAPFDKDWIYTKERIINYTNVPGGRYQLYYKATTDPNNWNVKEKILLLTVGTVFYKTTWFWLIMLLLTTAVLYWGYKKRIAHKEKIYQLQGKAQSLEKEKALVQYESLKQQLNPHFLFNSITSLSSLIRFDQKLAGEFLEGLSKIYRYILKSRNSELVYLGEEIKFAQTYTRLQQTRFNKGLRVNINVDEEQYHYKIVPVTLQNLIENAIKHNIMDDETPLVIDIYTHHEYLAVRNNLQKKNFVETSNKQGLANMQSLYRYLVSRPVIIEETENYFTVKIPLV